MILKKKKKKKRKKKTTTINKQTHTWEKHLSSPPDKFWSPVPSPQGGQGLCGRKGSADWGCFSFSAPCFTLSCSSVGSSTHQNQTCFPCLLSFLLQLLLKLQFCFGVSPAPRVSSLLLLWCVLLLLPPPLALFLLSRCLPVS